MTNDEDDAQFAWESLASALSRAEWNREFQWLLTRLTKEERARFLGWYDSQTKMWLLGTFMRCVQ